jgi:hypothetical protein
MKPIKNSLTTTILSAPANYDEDQHGPCESLAVQQEGGVSISYWKPNMKERFHIA